MLLNIKKLLYTNHNSCPSIKITVAIKMLNLKKYPAFSDKVSTTIYSRNIFSEEMRTFIYIPSLRMIYKKNQQIKKKQSQI